jgi:hypothetical protein
MTCGLEASSYLVSLVSSGGSSLALLARGELGEVAVVVTLPAMAISNCQYTRARDMRVHGDCRRKTYILW